MKKILLLVIPLLLITGCYNINNENLNDLVKNTVVKNKTHFNQFRSGYKYYLPNGLSVLEDYDYNEIITNDKYQYYLYVDIISYNYQTKFKYDIDNNSYYSNNINLNNKTGYLEINKQKNKYLVEMMYNYAKIEVMVDEYDLKETVANCSIILSSIKYNKNVINNIIGDNNISSKTINFDIFKTKKKESNFINYVKEYDNYKEEKIPDLDKVK